MHGKRAIPFDRNLLEYVWFNFDHGHPVIVGECLGIDVVIAIGAAVAGHEGPGKAPGGYTGAIVRAYGTGRSCAFSSDRDVEA